MDQTSIENKIRDFDFGSYRYKDELTRIAKSIVDDSCHVKAGERILLYFDEPALPLMHSIYLFCKERGAILSFFLRDYDTIAREVSELSLEEIEHYCDEEAALILGADNIIMLRGPVNPEILDSIPEEKRKLYLKKNSDAHAPRMSRQVEWLLFYWPTEYDARIEGVSYEQYFHEMLDACDLDWNAISRVQQKLVDMLNNGKRLTLIANADNPDPQKRTEVNMSIEGMTFVNSTIYANFPGSEVFSAPVKTSVNGQIFAEGVYLYNGHHMEDIFFKIEDGKIIEGNARVGNEGLQEILNSGEGSRYFGEVAIGTNPKLKRRFFNPLLNEKVGGSFHMAVGQCYTFTSDLGVPVQVNNGNTGDLTPIHWDVAILMHHNGKIILDGTVIQENGIFLDPDLAMLNR